jgi:adenylate cyclase
VGTEIERKFLVTGDAWRAAATEVVEIRQGYLAATPECSVRVRISGDDARLNIKSGTLDIVRQEFDYAIPARDAREMMETLCGGRSVSKTRYYVPYAGHLWEVDEFSGANSGLIVAEIELDAVDEAFDKPGWIGAEVSDEPRYYNACLIDHPFCEW